MGVRVKPDDGKPVFPFKLLKRFIEGVNLFCGVFELMVECLFGVTGGGNMKELEEPADIVGLCVREREPEEFGTEDDVG